MMYEPTKAYIFGSMLLSFMAICVVVILWRLDSESKRIECATGKQRAPKVLVVDDKGNFLGGFGSD